MRLSNLNFSNLNFGVSCLFLTLAVFEPSHGAEPVDAKTQATSLSEAFRQAASATIPAVVTINAKADPRNDQRVQQLQQMLEANPRLKKLFPDGVPDASQMPLDPYIGSGLLVDKEGLILTNNHVVDGASDILVRLQDGKEFDAEKIGVDVPSDLAILKITAPYDLPAAQLGDSQSVDIGDWVIAIGSPFELEATVSAGIISAKGRSLPGVPRSRLLQTDAAINPGNSGGPLVNLDGEVVGINTVIASITGGFQGVGFAVPVNQAKWIMRELVDYGKVRRAWLGIEIGELDSNAAKQLDLPVRSGVRVLNVVRNGPAANGGLRSDDVIVEFGGQSVRSPGELQSVVEQQPIGSSREVIAMRSGDRVVLSVELQAFRRALDDE